MPSIWHSNSDPGSFAAMTGQQMSTANTGHHHLHETRSGSKDAVTAKASYADLPSVSVFGTATLLIDGTFL